MKKINYSDWQLELIKVIANDKVFDKPDKTMQGEINCVLNGDFKTSYEVGDTPQEAWDSEKSYWD